MRILSGAIVILAAATVFAGTMIYSGLIKAVEIQLRGGGYQEFTNAGVCVAIVLGLVGVGLLLSGLGQRDGSAPDTK
jgi:hypothetical protein